MRNGSSLLGLVKELKDGVKIFIREEIQLAKTEMAEKISCFGGNSAAVGIGGFVAYAGLIILLAGLGAVLAFAFERDVGLVESNTGRVLARSGAPTGRPGAIQSL